MTKVTALYNRLIAYFQDNPKMLGLDMENPEIVVLKSILKKRYTEFYRVRVFEKKNSCSGPKHIWIRILKNKDIKSIFRSIAKQYAIMSILHSYLEKHVTTYKLTCSKPISILPDFGALITLECEGILFDKYLKRKIPLFSKKEISGYFYHIGVWLKAFHECFAEERVKSLLLRKVLNPSQADFDIQTANNYDFQTLCHMDFSPMNIFVTPGGVCGIDFVGSVYGNPKMDINFFENYIKSAKLNGAYSKKSKLVFIDSFRNGYNKKLNHR